MGFIRLGLRPALHEHMICPMLVDICIGFPKLRCKCDPETKTHARTHKHMILNKIQKSKINNCNNLNE